MKKHVSELHKREVRIVKRITTYSITRNNSFTRNTTITDIDKA